MNTRIRGNLMSLPFFKGPTGYQKVMADKYRTMSHALHQAGLEITELVVSPRRAWSLRLNNGILLRLGRENMIGRVDRLIKVFDSVLRSRVKDIYAIDLRYSNGFAVKWKRGKKVKRYDLGGKGQT